MAPKGKEATKVAKEPTAKKDTKTSTAGASKAAGASKSKTESKADSNKATAKTTKAAAKPAAKATKAAPASKKSAAAVTKSTTTKPKAAATKKAAPTKAAAEKKATKNGNGKRPIDDAEDDAAEDKASGSTVDKTDEREQRPVKKARVAAVPKDPATKRREAVLRRRKRNVVDNPVPTKPLDVFVFGEGTSGELGLGSKKYDGKKKPIDVKRPRINHNLSAETVGIVDIACGGMHAIALTKDNRVLTWGVNDDKALGRDTTWSGGVRDVDAEDSDEDDEDDTGINPLESTPTQIENGELQESDIICKVVACDSASFVLTTDGFVFGWGTFRGNDGIIGFSEGVRVQPTPVLINPLRDITKIACGSNHVIAVDARGKVWTWGGGSQYQLGRRAVSRHAGPTATLHPEPCGMFGKKHFAVDVAAGSYHSFYIDNQQRVWSWGLNNYSQTGHSEDIGEDDAKILQPKLVESLQNLKIEMIAGGEHHSVACSGDGKLLTWGRVDGHQVGQPSGSFTEENTVFDENKRPRILLEPTPVPDINTKFVATGVDTSFAINNAGRVYSWGFSANYQTGLGVEEDVEVPTLIDNSAIHDRVIIWAGAGGQFSMLAAEHGAQRPAATNES